MANETKAKILSFERNAEYYYRRYEQCLDLHQLSDALGNIRRACELDPQNQHYTISMAEVYTEMNLCEESNVLLLPLLHNDCPYLADILFNVGYNFFALREYEKARSYLSAYLEKFPNDDYVENAEGMLDAMDEDDALNHEYLLTPEEIALAEEGQFCIGIGDFKNAVKAFEKLSHTCKDQVFALNNLSLALHCCGKTDRAIEVARKVLDLEPQNTHALCNLALFQKEKGVTNAMNVYLSRLSSLAPADAEESIKILLTYCDLDETDKIGPLLTKILPEKPFDTKVLFLAGVHAANNKNYKEAFAYFDNIMKLAPMDTIAPYYRALMQHAMNGKEIPPLDYFYQLPMKEIRRRLKYLDHYADMDPQELQELWQQEDPKLKNILMWGLYNENPGVQSFSLNLLNLIEDESVISILKDFLLQPNQPNELKNEIFLMLNQHGVPFPYLASINGKIAEVSLKPRNQEPLPENYQEVLNYAINTPYAQGDFSVINTCDMLIRNYLGELNPPPAVRKPEIWGAAFLFLALVHLPEKPVPDLEEICEDLQLSYQAVHRCLHKIMVILETIEFPYDEEEE